MDDASTSKVGTPSQSLKDESVEALRSAEESMMSLLSCLLTKQNSYVTTV